LTERRFPIKPSIDFPSNLPSISHQTPDASRSIYRLDHFPIDASLSPIDKNQKKAFPRIQTCLPKPFFFSPAAYTSLRSTHRVTHPMLPNY
jgi:hypothetical protein